MMDNLATGTDATHEFAKIALNSARRGESLTYQLLSYARLQVLLPTPLEIVPFLTDMRELLSRTWASALMRIDPYMLSKTDPPTKSAMLESYA